MSYWFDIGANLTDKRLDAGAEIESACAAGVQRIAVTGTTVEGSEQALNLAHKYPNNLFSTAGVHPHYSKDVAANYLIKLTELAQDPQVIAIGECGLDFNRNFSPPDIQIKVFEQQLLLAADLSMPVFLHERDAFEQQISLLSKHRHRMNGGVVHCFTGSLPQMLEYIDLGFYIGITGWVCDPKRGEALRHAVSQLPIDRVLLETDAPYLMPKTLKSKSRNNQPANLPHIAQAVATLMNIGLNELQQCSLNNAHKLFQIKSMGSEDAV